MKISRAKLLETAFGHSFQANAAARRMILDGLEEGGPGGVEKIRSAYMLAHPHDLLAWSYLKDSSSAEIVRAAQDVVDRYEAGSGRSNRAALARDCRLARASH